MIERAETEVSLEDLHRAQTIEELADVSCNLKDTLRVNTLIGAENFKNILVSFLDVGTLKNIDPENINDSLRKELQVKFREAAGQQGKTVYEADLALNNAVMYSYLLLLGNLVQKKLVELKAEIRELTTEELKTNFTDRALTTYTLADFFTLMGEEKYSKLWGKTEEESRENIAGLKDSVLNSITGGEDLNTTKFVAERIEEIITIERLYTRVATLNSKKPKVGRLLYLIRQDIAEGRIDDIEDATGVVTDLEALDETEVPDIVDKEYSKLYNAPTSTLKERVEDTTYGLFIRLLKLRDYNEEAAKLLHYANPDIALGKIDGENKDVVEFLVQSLESIERFRAEQIIQDLEKDGALDQGIRAQALANYLDSVIKSLK